MSKNFLKDKSYSFAISIVKEVEMLMNSRKEFTLTRQLLKSGTAIGALIREAEFAQSRADFINKLSIALKEANETQYWLSLLKDTKYISEENFGNLSSTCNELLSMLVASIKTAKSVGQ